MIHAYDECYRGAAQRTLGRSFDFAVENLGFELGGFFARFVDTGIAVAFGRGDYRYITGMSGVELAWLVTGQDAQGPAGVILRDAYGSEYWTGWALAYYQWHCGKSFERIDALVPVERVRALYAPYHEMDILQFVDKMDELCRQARPEPALKHRRVELGLSQAQLAELSDVPVRTVQQYEQRQKSINRASAETVARLAQVLWCPAEALLEYDSMTR